MNLWIFFFFGFVGGFQMFFFLILILCLKIDIFKFCDVFVCQESSTIFEKVAINFFSILKTKK